MTKKMNSRERMLCVLNHREPDRVPIDLGGTQVSSIHVDAHRALCEHLDIDPEPVVMADVVQQVVTPCDALLERLEIDTRGLFPGCSHNRGFEHAQDKGDCIEHVDEWGFTQRIKKQGGFWWSQIGAPLDGMEVDPDALAAYRWPDAADPTRLVGLRQQAEAYRNQGKIVVCKGISAGLLEMGQRIRGMSNFLCDLLADPKTAETILDRILESKKQFWGMLLDEIGDLVDIVAEADDYGTQQSQLISLDTFKSLMEPRLRELIGFIKERHALRRPADEPGFVFFHSCGNVRPYLPDFIEMGIDILNPVHISASGMEPESLKKEYGREIVFWGGGVETQHVLPTGTPEEVREDVRRNVEALMPGGGYVFGTVHNIQAEVPPENLMAMWEAFREAGVY